MKDRFLWCDFDIETYHGLRDLGREPKVYIVNTGSNKRSVLRLLKIEYSVGSEKVEITYIYYVRGKVQKVTVSGDGTILKGYVLEKNIPSKIVITWSHD